jgi:hypothetical protein
MPVTYYGVRGKSYESIEEAWTDYFNELYGDIDAMTSEEYHDKFLLFASGILSGLNIAMTRFQFLHEQRGVPDGVAIQRAIMTLGNEAMTIAAEEYRRAGRGQ